MPRYVNHWFPKKVVDWFVIETILNIALFIGSVCFSISTDVENSWTELWKSNFELNPDLHLPAENKYIGQ